MQRWSRKRGVRLLSVGYVNDWADEQRATAGPIEFAELMAGAQAVITNFFHGCVFALLNDKPWAAHPSDYRSIKIPDLARLVGEEDRLIAEGSSIDELLSTPVSEGVQRRIREHRECSDAFLDAALA